MHERMKERKNEGDFACAFSLIPTNCEPGADYWYPRICWVMFGLEILQEEETKTEVKELDEKTDGEKEEPKADDEKKEDATA